MFTMVYRSTAVVPFTEADLDDLVAGCRTKNRKLGLTGILLHEHGRFIQALEGPEYMVRELMQTIAADPRHEQIEVLAEDETEARRFPDWSMGYRSIDEIQARTVPGYEDVISRGRTQDPAPRARVLLDWFRTH